MRAGILFGLLTLMLSGCGESGGAGKAAVKAAPKAEFVISQFDTTTGANTVTIKNIGNSPGDLGQENISVCSVRMKDQKIQKVYRVRGKLDAGQEKTFNSEDFGSKLKLDTGSGERGSLLLVTNGSLVLSGVQHGAKKYKKTGYRENLWKPSEPLTFDKYVPKKITDMFPKELYMGKAKIEASSEEMSRKRGRLIRSADATWKRPK